MRCIANLYFLDIAPAAVFQLGGAMGAPRVRLIWLGAIWCAARARRVPRAPGALAGSAPWEPSSGSTFETDETKRIADSSERAVTLSPSVNLRLPRQWHTTKATDPPGGARRLSQPY
jgi:hypothetical protein